MPRREWSVPQRQFLVEKKLQGICVAQKQDMVVRSVLKMKERARSCVAVGGGVFEGRKV